MSAADDFFDTSILLYLLSNDADKADRVERLLERQGTISVQVLNEFAAVALRKCKMPLSAVREVLESLRAVCSVESLTLTTHDAGLGVCERYGFSLYDSMIVSAALTAKVKVLYSEDLQHGQLIDNRLRIINPFVSRQPPGSI
jgi:predicted nucleic acid-binding protein